MEDNLQYAWERLHDLSTHTLLTGNAGTGKSTLIRKFIADNIEETVVLAPTGIAAVNIGGQTIHSFFHFPGRPLSYNAVKWLNPSLDPDFLKRELIRKAKYFVIDEISMVRADLMDQIQWFFHKNFGGVGFAGKKLIMIGDLDQLPPVVATDEEREMIVSRYPSEFFFHANCWNPLKENSSTFEVVKLTKVWRQTDPQFIELLNDIKTNNLSPDTIFNLNKKCYREDDRFSPEDGIVLCATNALANDINSEMIHNRLEGDLIKLEGEIKGTFDKKSCTVEPMIELKIGCRVMIMKNSIGFDPEESYANGEIGVLKEYNKEQRELFIKMDNGKNIIMGQYEFESIEYTYDKKEDKILHKKVGTFLQYPIKVAYAITIHKSQGQSFDKVIIDLGEKGAFAHGQTYVALSRCRSLEGLILRRPISHRDLIYNKNVLQFNKTLV